MLPQELTEEERQDAFKRTLARMKKVGRRKETGRERGWHGLRNALAAGATRLLASLAASDAHVVVRCYGWSKRHLCGNSCLFMCMVSQLRSLACTAGSSRCRLWVPPLTWRRCTWTA